MTSLQVIALAGAVGLLTGILVAWLFSETYRREIRDLLALNAQCEDEIAEWRGRWIEGRIDGDATEEAP